MLTRKQFLKNAGTVTAGISLMPISSLHPVSQTSATIYFDLHAHPGESNEGLDQTQLSKTVNEMNQGHLTGGFFALEADAPLLKLTATGIVVTGKYAEGEGWKEYKRQLDEQRNLLQKCPQKYQ